MRTNRKLKARGPTRTITVRIDTKLITGLIETAKVRKQPYSELLEEAVRDKIEEQHDAITCLT